MNMHTTQLPLYAWLLLAVLLFSQGTWIFIDASKRDAHPWPWALWGLISCPLPLILYLLIERKIWNRKK